MSEAKKPDEKPTMNEVLRSAIIEKQNAAPKRTQTAITGSKRGTK